MSRGYCNVTPVLRPDAGKLHKYGPFLKEGTFSKYLNNFPFKYWRGRSLIFPFSYSNTLAWFLGFIPNEIKSEYGSFDRLFVSLPSYINSFRTLTLFSELNEGCKKNFNLKLLNIDSSLHRLRLPKNIRCAEKEDVLYAKVTLDTHPGIITRKVAERFSKKNKLRLNKRITKGNILFSIVNDLMNSWHLISDGRVGGTIGTYCVGSREKIQKVDLGDPVESRPLWIPEMTDVIFGSTWLELLKEKWQANGLFKSEIWLGHSDTKKRYYRRLELDVKYRYSYEFDGKLWDSSVRSEVIVKAFNIYASCFVSSKKVCNHFQLLCDTFVLKRVILHNGNSFLISNGVPSGHAWTSHINSMCNWIIWTSTIMNCPFVPEAFRHDYCLQIQGDDVGLHSNILLPEETRKKIGEWMLKNFNYKVLDDTIEPCKSKVRHSNDASSFLKRFTNVYGNLETKKKDIWKKLIFGADYTGTRRSRYTYLLRRINDLAISDEQSLYEVARYIVFIRRFEKIDAKRPNSEIIYRHQTIFSLLFYFTNGFTYRLDYIWKFFLAITEFQIDGFNDEVEQLVVYLKNVYRDNYWSYDSSRVYVDYWMERKPSVSVAHAMRNYCELPISVNTSMFKKLHGPFKKNRFKLK